VRQSDEQIFHEAEVVARNGQHGFRVARFYRLEQIEERALLYKLAREASIGAEQQRPLAADDASVEMRHRHRRRTHRCLAVDLRMMTAGDVRSIAAQPDAADGKAAVPSALRYLRFLQQRACPVPNFLEESCGTAIRSTVIENGIGGVEWRPRKIRPALPSCQR